MIRKARLTIPKVELDTLTNVFFTSFTKVNEFPITLKETFDYKENGSLVTLNVTTTFSDKLKEDSTDEQKVKDVIRFFVNDKINYKSIFSLHEDSAPTFQKEGGIEIKQIEYEYLRDQSQQFLPVTCIFNPETVPNWFDDHTRKLSLPSGLWSSTRKISSYIHFMNEYSTVLKYTNTRKLHFYTFDSDITGDWYFIKEDDKDVNAVFELDIDVTDDLEKFKPVYLEKIFTAITNIGFKLTDEDIENYSKTITWFNDVNTARVNYIKEFENPMDIQSRIYSNDSLTKTVTKVNDIPEPEPLNPHRNELNDFLNYLGKTGMSMEEYEKREKEKTPSKDDLEFTKIKLKMIKASDLFKKKWEVVETAMKMKSHSYVITPSDLAFANCELEKPSKGYNYYFDYFDKHFSKRTLTPTEFEIWGKIGQEWLEDGNDPTPIPMDGSDIKVTDLIHTLMFAPPLNIDDYLKSAMCDQKEESNWTLSGNIDTIIKGAYNQVPLSDTNTKRSKIIGKSMQDFYEKYSNGQADSNICIGNFCNEFLDKIKEYFTENYTENWMKVRDIVSDKYYFNVYNYVKGGRLSTEELSVCNTVEVYNKILKDLFNIDTESAEYANEFRKYHLFGVKFTLNDIDHICLDTWADELYNLVKRALDDPRGTCECVIANYLIKYAYVPSLSWGVTEFYNKIHESRLNFDTDLVNTLYYNNWQKVYDAIRIYGKYKVTLDDIKNGVTKYYIYREEQVSKLSNNKAYLYINLDRVIDNIYRILDIDNYVEFEITPSVFEQWKFSTNLFEEVGVRPVVPDFYASEFDFTKAALQYQICDKNNKDTNKFLINGDILKNSFMFVPPACMEDFYKRNNNIHVDDYAIDGKAVAAVEAINKVAEEAIKSMDN